MKCRKDYILSAICVVILVIFMVVLLLPGVFSDHTIETETYALLAGWSILGIFFFNSIIRKDHARKFGKAIVVWIALLAFIVLVTLTLASMINDSREDKVMDEIESYMDGTADSEMQAMSREAFLENEKSKLHDAKKNSFMVVAGLFVLSLTVLFVNYRSMNKWEKKTAEERDQARDAAFKDPLTGVKSKHAFAVYEGSMETQITDGDMGEFGVIVGDVNGLKRINDTLGHKAGDEYIRSACMMLCEYFKHSPVFRVGGDEFVVILQGHDFNERNEILSAINEKIEGNIGSNNAVISLGTAIYDPGKDESFHEVFKRADGLMYERKQQLKSMGAVTRE